MRETAAFPHETPPTGGTAAVAAGLRALLPRLQTPRCMRHPPRISDFATYGEIVMSARTARDHGFGVMRLASLVSYIDPPNTRSIRLAERLGACVDDAAAAEFTRPVLVYRHAPVEARQ